MIMLHYVRYKNHFFIYAFQQNMNLFFPFKI